MLVPNIPIESDGKMRVTVIPAKPQTENAKKKMELSGLPPTAEYLQLKKNRLTAMIRSAGTTTNTSAVTKIGKRLLSSRTRVSPALRRRNARNSSK